MNKSSSTARQVRIKLRHDLLEIHDELIGDSISSTLNNLLQSHLAGIKEKNENYKAFHSK